MSNIYWSEEEFLRPAFISDDVWHSILNNFLSHVGNPVSALPNALQDDIDRLVSLGLSQPSDLAALRFELQQAGDFGSLAERGQIGSLGQGWSSLADIKLLIADDGSKSVTGLVNADILTALDANETAQYAVSLPLGKIIGQDGRFVESGAFARPSFTTNQSVDGDMTLTTITGGHQVTTGAGDKFIFNQDGKLTSFVSSAGEVITVIYDVNDRISRYENTTGDFLEFTYDTAGKITSTEDGNGRIVSTTYSVNGELIAINDDAGDTDFTYDTGGNLLKAQRVGGAELTFTYDAEGRLASQDIGGQVSESYTYDNAGAITITNGLGGETIVQIGPGGSFAGLENNLGQSLTITTDVNARTVNDNNVEILRRTA